MNKSDIVYNVIFERIKEQLGKGELPWARPWHSRALGRPRNPLTGTVYSGSNALLTWLDQLNGRSSANYATYSQWNKAGRQVAKGSKGLPIVYWGTGKTEKQTPTGETKESKYAFVKYFTVFCEDQLEDFKPIELPEIVFKPLERAESILKSSPLANIRIVHDKQSAFYSPSLDYVNMPRPETFRSVESYYSTLWHEIGHATGHENRLARDLSGIFGNHSYSREELVAELTSAFLCAESGIENQIEQSAAYCKGWLKKFEDEPKEMLKAFGQAAKAADYILNVKRNAESEAVA